MTESPQVERLPAPERAVSVVELRLGVPAESFDELAGLVQAVQSLVHVAAHPLPGRDAGLQQGPRRGSRPPGLRAAAALLTATDSYRQVFLACALALAISAVAIAAAGRHYHPEQT